MAAMVIYKKCFMAPQLHSSVTRLYHTYRRVSGGGADGRVKGVIGSINPLAVFCMLMAMKVGGRTLFDFGCSEGRFLLTAALQGARKAIGVEFPENIGHQYLFDAVRKSMQRSYGVLPAEWIGRNVDLVTSSCHDVAEKAGTGLHGFDDIPSGATAGPAPRMVSIAEAERIRIERVSDSESRIRATETRKRCREEARSGAAYGGAE